MVHGQMPIASSRVVATDVDVPSGGSKDGWVEIVIDGVAMRSEEGVYFLSCRVPFTSPHFTCCRWLALEQLISHGNAGQARGHARIHAPSIPVPFPSSRPRAPIRGTIVPFLSVFVVLSRIRVSRIARLNFRSEPAMRFLPTRTCRRLPATRWRGRRMLCRRR